MVLQKLEQVEEAARYMALQTASHCDPRAMWSSKPSNVIRARIPWLRNDRGMAIHVLSDVAGQEIELLAFDCFGKGAHYHYGPRIRMYGCWDRTTVPDTLEWTPSNSSLANSHP